MVPGFFFLAATSGGKYIFFKPCDALSKHSVTAMIHFKDCEVLPNHHS